MTLKPIAFEIRIQNQAILIRSANRCLAHDMLQRPFALTKTQGRNAFSTASVIRSRSRSSCPLRTSACATFNTPEIQKVVGVYAIDYRCA
ncbi:hypothetical protein BC834DRAFT_240149 [Gloeopeniophorella convolvens]|nr:hypothetical protein BC834DRAFT_240149 [Gloeopeniophorella convolvens]